jgi:hypothetical protein
MKRLDLLGSHLHASPQSVFVAGKKQPDDVVIVAAVRTPLTRARKGGIMMKLLWR